MKKLLTKIALVTAGISGVAYAQQDPQFTQFMFNKLVFNPGYAGTSGKICGVAQFRQQWVSFPGAPQSMALSGDMPISGLPIGVGLNVMTDNIGTLSTFYLRGAGSFLISMPGKGKLGIGLDLGVIQKKLNGPWIVPEPLAEDKHIPGTYSSFTNPNFSKLSYDVGFGAFYQIPDKFYVGISSTHLPAQTLTNQNLGFKVSRHYYFTAGYNYEVNTWLTVSPNILYKSDLASSSLDLNCNLVWFRAFWVGGTYRLNDAGAFLMGLQQGFGAGNKYTAKFGYSYDFTTSKLRTYSKGTHEIFLGVCYAPKVHTPTHYISDRFD